MNWQKTSNNVRAACQALVKGAIWLQSPLLLAIRLCWGWQFFQAGWGKLMNLERTAEFFGTLGIPFPTLNAAMAATTECVGGLLLVVGLASRLTAIPLIVTMIVALLTADIDVVKNIFEAPDKFLEAAPFPFLLASLLVLAFGPGAISLDAWIARKFGVPLEVPAPDAVSRAS